MQRNITLLSLPGWRRFRNIARKQKSLARAIIQTKIRQVRSSAIEQFDYLIPRDYKHALELNKLNGNNRWYDATKTEMDNINGYQVFKNHGKAKYDPKSKQITKAAQGYQKIKVHLVLHATMMGATKVGW